MSANLTSNDLLVYGCFDHPVYYNIFTAFTALRGILLLPFTTVILYLGHKQWRQQHSFKTASHSDIFTYHMVAMELIWVLGGVFLYVGLHTYQFVMISAGHMATTTAYYGEMFFHLLTCVERYLAVVHPFTYLCLRNARGVRIRNISIGCVWLLSFGFMGVTFLCLPHYTIVPLFCILIFSIIILSFCSLSVLCVLIHPGPGDGGREKERADQSKQKAFNAITAISGAVWLWFVGLLAFIALSKLPLLSDPVRCAMELSGNFFNLPSCLVLPLLYLYRANNFSCQWVNSERCVGLSTYTI